MRAADIKVGGHYMVEGSQNFKHYSIHSPDMRVEIVEVPVHPYQRYVTGGRWAYTRVTQNVDTFAPKNSALVKVLDKETGEPLTYAETHEDAAGEEIITRVFLREIRMTWDEHLQAVKDYEKRRKAERESREKQDRLRAANEKRMEEMNAHLATFGLEVDRALLGRGNAVQIRATEYSADARYGSQERVEEDLIALNKMLEAAQSWRQ